MTRIVLILRYSAGQTCADSHHASSCFTPHLTMGRSSRSLFCRLGSSLGYAWSVAVHPAIMSESRSMHAASEAAKMCDGRIAKCHWLRVSLGDQTRLTIHLCHHQQTSPLTLLYITLQTPYYDPLPRSHASRHHISPVLCDTFTARLRALHTPRGPTTTTSASCDQLVRVKGVNRLRGPVLAGMRLLRTSLAAQRWGIISAKLPTLDMLLRSSHPVRPMDMRTTPQLSKATVMRI